jgi:asparagine N-glycosylation enzyme membrane subunit Stt3
MSVESLIKTLVAAVIVFAVFSISTAILLPHLITPSFDYETTTIFALTPTAVGIIAVIATYFVTPQIYN